MKKKLNKFMSLLLAAVFVISTVFTAFADTEMVGVADAEEVVAAEAAEAAEVAEALAPEAAEEAAEEAMLGATVYDIKCAYGEVTWILRAEEISRGESSINRVLDRVGIPRRQAKDAVAAASLSSETYFSFDKTSGSDIGEWKIKCGSGTPTATTLSVTVDGKDYAIGLSKYPPEKNQKGDFQIVVNGDNRNLAYGEKGTYVLQCKNAEYTKLEYFWSFTEKPETGIAKFVSKEGNQCVIEPTGTACGAVNIFCDVFFTDKNGDEWRSRVGSRITVGDDVPTGYYLDYDTNKLELGEAKKLTIKLGYYEDFTLEDITKTEWSAGMTFAELSPQVTDKDLERTITAKQYGSGNVQVRITYQTKDMKNPGTWNINQNFYAEEQREDRPPFEFRTDSTNKNLAKGEVGEYKFTVTDDTVTVKDIEWFFEEHHAKGLVKFVSETNVNPVKLEATGVDGYIDLVCHIKYEREKKVFDAYVSAMVTTGADVRVGPYLELGSSSMVTGQTQKATIKPGTYVCPSVADMLQVDMREYDKDVIQVKKISKTEYEVTALKAGTTDLIFDIHYDKENPDWTWGLGNMIRVLNLSTMKASDTWIPKDIDPAGFGEVRIVEEGIPEGAVDLGTVDEQGLIHAYEVAGNPLSMMLILVPQDDTLVFNEDSSRMFSRFTSMYTFNIHTNFVDGSRMKNLDGMFAGCKELKYADLNFYTQGSASTNDTFKDCKKIEYLNIHTGKFRLFAALPADVTYSCADTGAKEISNLQLANEPKGPYLYTVIGKATEVDKPVDTSEAKSEGTGDPDVVIDQIKKNKKADVSAEGILSAVKREALAEAAGVKLEDVENIKLSANAKLIGINADKEADKTVAKKLKFEISPVAEIETKAGATMPANVTNGMLNGGKIKVSVPLPDTDRNAVEIVHVSQGMPNETFTVYINKELGSGNYFVEFEITHFSTFEMTFVDKHDDPTPTPRSYSSGSTKLFTGTWNNPVSNGTWTQDAAGNWHYTTTQMFRNTWGYIVNPYAKEGQNKADWFWFDPNGNMLSGWQLINGKWYYLNPAVGSGVFGACLIGPGMTPDGYEIDASGAWTGK